MTCPRHIPLVIALAITSTALADDTQLRMLKAQLALQRKQIAKLQQDLAVMSARNAKLQAACRKAGITVSADPPKKDTTGKKPPPKQADAGANDPPALAFKQPVPEKIKRLIEESRKQKAERIHSARTYTIPRLKKYIQRIRYGRGGDPKKRKALLATKRAELAAAEKSHAALIADSSFYFPVIQSPLAVGTIGRLTVGNYVNVNQIVNAQEMLVNVSVMYRPPGESLERILKYTVWVRGFPTKNLVDGHKIDFPVPLEVTSTKQYETVAGAGKTIFLLEPFDLSKYTAKPKPVERQPRASVSVKPSSGRPLGRADWRIGRTEYY